MAQNTDLGNRRAVRSNVLLSASLEVGGAVRQVRLRNLSASGALVEGAVLPAAGAELLFRRGELAVAGRVAWVRAGRAGIAFAEPLAPEQLLRHVPAPRHAPAASFKRPGVATSSLTAAERKLMERWT